MADHLRISGPHRAKIHAEGLNEFHRQIGDELRGTLSPYLLTAIATLPDDNPIRPFMQFLADQPGEGAAISSMLAAGGAIGQSLGSGLADLLAPANQAIMQLSPNLLIGAGQAAQLAVQGLLDENSAYEISKSNGLGQQQFGYLKQLTQQWLDVGSAQDAYRRGLIDEPTFGEYLHLLGIQGDAQSLLVQLTRNLLQPADLALMVLKGIMPQAEAATIAKQSGITAEDFNSLLLATGEPPGAEQLMEAYRRHFIDEPTFEHGIRQSRIRDEWITTLLDLRYAPMDTSDAVRGFVQNYLTRDQATTIADANGLEPGAIDTLLLIEGNPIAMGEALELLNRGLIDQATAEQAMRESHLKDKYIPAALNLRVKLPEGRQVVQMVQHGALSNAEALLILGDLGYQPNVAAALLKEGTSTKTTANRALASGQILELYEEQAITAGDAKKMLLALGYQDSDATWVISLSDLKMEWTYIRAAISHIRSAVVGKSLSLQDASGQLDHLQLRSEHRDQLIHIWELELAASVARLTPTQILKALSAGGLTNQDAYDRLTAQGYDTADAELLIATVAAQV
jgi:hypothetical protein